MQNCGSTLPPLPSDLAKDKESKRNVPSVPSKKESASSREGKQTASAKSTGTSGKKVRQPRYTIVVG
ncbi:hypothetical protein KC19_VG038000 [Ceratodon purpureus]|uniref:Uncharacterized protein n=1 Tax=Ceratodon purpureus TaxID=3225 RepID=A0A8T0HLS2_CERPU|nr:hypothetical protein KC19_VG038000 [Ceratodon purpureus]